MIAGMGPNGVGKSTFFKALFGLLLVRSGKITLGTILLIEQNAKKALALSDYGTVLQQGRLALAGGAQDVLNHPEIGHLFLGRAVQIEASR